MLLHYTEQTEIPMVTVFSAKGDTGRTGLLRESRVSPWGTRRPGGCAGWGCTSLPAPLL